MAAPISLLYFFYDSPVFFFYLINKSILKEISVANSNITINTTLLLRDSNQIPLITIIIISNIL